MKKIKIKLPQLILVYDYHELGELQYLLNSLADKTNIKVDEYGFDNNSGKYVGLIRTDGEIIEQEEIERQIKINGILLNES